MYHQRQQFQAHHGAMDPVAARQKEEQRRKQQAYAQALAQQVQQRELQKQRNKAIERQGTSHGRPQGGYQDPSGGGGSDKGLFDGFGEKGNQNRTNFARGQRHPSATAAPPQYDQQHQVSPTRYGNTPEPRDQFEHLRHNPQGFHQQQNQRFGGNDFNNPDFGFPTHGNPQLFAQPQQLQNLPPAPMGGATGFNDWGAPLNPQQLGFLNEQVGQQEQQHFHYHQQHEDRFVQHFDHQPQQQQQQQLQYQQNPHHHEPQGQRGLRSDPSSGGFGGPGGPIGGLGIGGDDDSKARRKLQQQQEIQNALQKQVEEKNRQKLEAKKRQEDEDRREIERFEVEKRRLKQEEDKLKEEKRRKTEEELVRAQQAALTLADHQKKAQQQQQHHLQNQQHLIHQQQQQEEQASPPRALHNHQKPNQPPFQQQHQLQQKQNQRSPKKLDPFANTRAHLFEDPPAATAAVPSPQRRVMMAPHSVVHDENEEEHSPMRHPMHRQPNSVPNFPHLNAHEAPRYSNHLAPRNGLPPPPFVDPTVLLRQYDEMKAELMHQRQIVDQLRQAHTEIQQ